MSRKPLKIEIYRIIISFLTDVHAGDGDWPIKPTLPFIPGHEGQRSDCPANRINY